MLWATPTVKHHIPSLSPPSEPQKDINTIVLINWRKYPPKSLWTWIGHRISRKITLRDLSDTPADTLRRTLHCYNPEAPFPSPSCTNSNRPKISCREEAIRQLREALLVWMSRKYSEKKQQDKKTEHWILYISLLKIQTSNSREFSLPFVFTRQQIKRLESPDLSFPFFPFPNHYPRKQTQTTTKIQNWSENNEKRTKYCIAYSYRYSFPSLQPKWDKQNP